VDDSDDHVVAAESTQMPLDSGNEGVVCVREARGRQCNLGVHVYKWRWDGNSVSGRADFSPSKPPMRKTVNKKSSTI
jgi:hypothetical protein